MQPSRTSQGLSLSRLTRACSPVSDTSNTPPSPDILGTLSTGNTLPQTPDLAGTFANPVDPISPPGLLIHQPPHCPVVPSSGLSGTGIHPAKSYQPLNPPPFGDGAVPQIPPRHSRFSYELLPNVSNTIGKSTSSHESALPPPPVSKKRPMQPFPPTDIKSLVEFRHAENGELFIDSGGNIKVRHLSISDRLIRKVSHGKNDSSSQQLQLQNAQSKLLFFNALIKAEGPEIANKARKEVGLEDDWLQNSTPLEKHQITALLKAAEKCRMENMSANDKAMRLFVNGDGIYAFTSTCNSHIGVRYLSRTEKNTSSPELHAIFECEVKRHSGYTKTILTQQQFQEIACKACDIFYAQKLRQLSEAFPHLTLFLSAEGLFLNFEEMFLFLQPKLKPVADIITAGEDAPLECEQKEFRQLALKCLLSIRDALSLFPKMAFNPAGWYPLTIELNSQLDDFKTLIFELEKMTPTTAVGKTLQTCISNEIKHQHQLLKLKRQFLDEIMANDPFSEKVIAFSNLCWANAANHLYLNAMKGTLKGPHRSPAQKRMGSALNENKEKMLEFIKLKNEEYLNAPSNRRTEIPEKAIILGKNGCIEFARRQLKECGMSDDEITLWSKPESVQDALRMALNGQKLTPETRTIFVHLNGLSRCYLSHIVPANCIDGFQWVSAIEKADQYQPRNLKLSQLFDKSTGRCMATIIGHGVLDMWGIEDQFKRAAANKNGAEEVLRLAAVSNDRVKNGGAAHIVHISINLTTPAGWRESTVAKKIKPDYQEQAYTLAQFAAFDAVERDGMILIENSRPISVEVITFSFGINPIATEAGILSDQVGGWNSVFEHNYKQMERYIGNLGSETKQTCVQGQRPGGFIGSVMDRVESAQMNPKIKQELLLKLQEQTDIVRALFLTEAYKHGNGDPAKMAREIALLQIYAEEALATVSAPVAATLSKGCKSDKDRGGVVDSEIKNALIVRDMGGNVVPGEKLAGEKKTIYMSVRASNEFQTHINNTSLPGSKAEGQDVDPEEENYLKALSSFTND